MEQLISRWGKEVTNNNVLQEYPRPIMVRDSYFNLNGIWKYKINNDKETDCYDGDILVPYPPESYLSGVKRILKPGEVLHYKKVFKLPDGFVKSRVILHFGAVDQECEVKLNGHKIGSHKGGYLPFSFDITEYLNNEENILEVSVVDETEFLPHARGKQKLVRKGKYSFIFYTPLSGIWKSVWLESVDDEYITSIRTSPDYDESSVKLLINTNKGYGQAKVDISIGGIKVTETTVDTDKEVSIKIDGFKEWTPDTPNLYDITITYFNDVVKSYFGMRKFSYQRDKNGILRFYLNNKPYFFNGVLNQGYWPESLMTQPSDEALKYDILKLKELGFNTIRCHVKVEDERFYYHCDRIGMIVWQDMPNGGGDYDMFFVTYMPNTFKWFGRCIKDNLYGKFKRQDEQGRIQYYEDLRGMINLLYNYTSIAVWTPFNEGWGQFDANKATELIRSMDSGRMINEACGWFDQKGGDIYSIHNYSPGLKIKPKRNRVVALTEFGGYAYPIEGHYCADKPAGYKKYNSKKELTEDYVKLMKEEVCANIKNGLSACIYTQTSDIENEINGLLTYDRALVKMEEDVVKESNKHLYELFDSLT